MPVETDLGARLFELRDERDWTQRELEEMSKVSHTTIAGIETGRIKSPRSSTLRKFARAFDMSLEEFLGKASPPQPPLSAVETVNEATLEELFELKDELMEEFEELNESIPMPAALARRLGQEPHRWTPQDKRNFRRLSALSRTLRRIFARLEAEAERELSGNVPLEEE